jgi:hypothetical protein
VSGGEGIIGRRAEVLRTGLSETASAAEGTVLPGREIPAVADRGRAPTTLGTDATRVPAKTCCRVITMDPRRTGAGDPRGGKTKT